MLQSSQSGIEIFYIYVFSFLLTLDIAAPNTPPISWHTMYGTTIFIWMPPHRYTAMVKGGLKWAPLSKEQMQSHVLPSLERSSHKPYCLILGSFFTVTLTSVSYIIFIYTLIS